MMRLTALILLFGSASGPVWAAGIVVRGPAPPVTAKVDFALQLHHTAGELTRALHTAPLTIPQLSTQLLLPPVQTPAQAAASLAAAAAVTGHNEHVQWAHAVVGH